MSVSYLGRIPEKRFLLAGKLKCGAVFFPEFA